jgi:hypothetical protein
MRAWRAVPELSAEGSVRSRSASYSTQQGEGLLVLLLVSRPGRHSMTQLVTAQVGDQPVGLVLAARAYLHRLGERGVGERERGVR